MNRKGREFGYFKRMKRKKISRVKSMAEITAEVMVGRLSKIEVFAVNDRGSDRWKNTRPKTGTEECEMGPSQQETPRELRRNRGSGRT